MKRAFPIIATLAMMAGLAFLVANPAGAGTGATGLPGCFGHTGVQIPGKTAYECVFQPTGQGGALYWSVNESSFNWDKHPSSGLLWVDAITQLTDTDSNPVNQYQTFNVIIAGYGNGCHVVAPGVYEEPTMCSPNTPFTPVQAASYEQFERSMEQLHPPDSAWANGHTIQTVALNGAFVACAHFANSTDFTHMCEWNTPGTGEIYLMDTKPQNWYVWFNPSGLVTQETFSKEAVNPAVNGRRVIAFANNRVIVDPGWLSAFPFNTAPPDFCQAPGKPMSACSTVEQNSAMGLQRTLVLDDVDYPL